MKTRGYERNATGLLLLLRATRIKTIVCVTMQLAVVGSSSVSSFFFSTDVGSTLALTVALGVLARMCHSGLAGVDIPMGHGTGNPKYYSTRFVRLDGCFVPLFLLLAAGVCG